MTREIFLMTPTGLQQYSPHINLGSGPVPASLFNIPSGFANVAAMLATPGFKVAHRGGSLDWPEMSLHAYTQCALRGVGALEVSLSRSADGVWFGLHDQTLDRTSGLTSAIDAATLNWSLIQVQPNLSPVGKPSQPYARFLDIVAAYGASHVMFVDPKYQMSTALRNEFLNMLDANGGPTRFVVKYHYSGTNLGNEARARGYKTWGYYYTPDLGSVASTHSAWDLLGLEASATLTAWNTIRGYGKPVLGHGVLNRDQQDRAISYGAAGTVVQAIRSVVGRGAV